MNHDKVLTCRRGAISLFAAAGMRGSPADRASGAIICFCNEQAVRGSGQDPNEARAHQCDVLKRHGRQILQARAAI